MSHIYILYLYCLQFFNHTLQNKIKNFDYKHLHNHTEVIHIKVVITFTYSIPSIHALIMNTDTILVAESQNILRL